MMEKGPSECPLVMEMYEYINSCLIKRTNVLKHCEQAMGKNCDRGWKRPHLATGRSMPCAPSVWRGGGTRGLSTVFLLKD